MEKFSLKNLIMLALLLASTLTQAKAVNKDSSQQNLQSETVVLLHGLARSSRSMNKMAKVLQAEGYRVVNLDYPSTKYPIEYLAGEWLGTQLQNCCSDAGKLHFVTHSMGGILLRYRQKHFGIENLGRVVMLSPPSQGSEVVDNLGELGVFKWINGTAGTQLSTASNSIPNQLGAVNYPVGVITGNKSINPVLSMLIPGDDDGKVSVERAKLAGMRDFIVLPHTHTFIMDADETHKQTIRFLRYGRFKHTDENWT